MDFTFDRSGYRVPAIMVSPWVESGSVFNEEYRHTSLIATLRKEWDLGEPLTGRDATARTFEGVFTRDDPRDPHTWPEFVARPVPEWTLDPDVVGRAVSTLGKAAIPGLVAHARDMGIELPPGFDDPDSEPPSAELVQLLREVAFHFFPASQRQSAPPNLADSLNGTRIDARQPTSRMGRDSFSVDRRPAQ